MAARFGSAVTVVHVREHTKYEGSDVDLGPETPADELVEAARSTGSATRRSRRAARSGG